MTGCSKAIQIRSNSIRARTDRTERIKIPATLSRRHPLERLDQPTKSLSADDPREIDRFIRLRRILSQRRKVTAARLRTRGIVVLDEFANEVIQVAAPEHQEVVQAFLLDRLNRALALGIQVR